MSFVKERILPGEELLLPPDLGLCLRSIDPDTPCKCVSVRPEAQTFSGHVL